MVRFTKSALYIFAVQVVLHLFGRVSISYAQECVDYPRLPSSFPTENWLKGGRPNGDPLSWEAHLNELINSQATPPTIVLKDQLQMPYYYQLNQLATNGNIEDLKVCDPANNACFPDYLPGDGWELVGKNIGDVGSYQNYAAWIFYNKYSTILRCFIYQATPPTTAANIAQICLYFKSSKVPVNGELQQQHLHPNLFTAATTPMDALSDFTDFSEDTKQWCTPNDWTNSKPGWLYADFPMGYDPCVCAWSSGDFICKLTLVNQSTIQLGSASNVRKGNISSNSGFSAVVKGFEKFSKLSDALGLKKDEAKDPQNKEKLTQELSILDAGKKIGALIPQASGVISAVSGLIDFFSGSDEKTASSMMLTNDNVNLSGTITDQWIESFLQGPLPGGAQRFGPSGQPRPNPLFYKYPLGNIALVKRPSVTIRKGYHLDNPCWTDLGNIDYDNAKNSVDLLFTLDDPVKLVINPYVGFDLSKAKVSASIEIEMAGHNSNRRTWGTINTNNGQYGFHRWVTEMEGKDFGAFDYVSSVSQPPLYSEWSDFDQSGSDLFEHPRLKLSTKPIDLNSMNGQIFRVKLGTDFMPAWNDYYYDWKTYFFLFMYTGYNLVSYTDYDKALTAYLKLFVTLPHPSGKNHVAILRYKLDRHFEGQTDCPDQQYQGYINDYIRPYYDTYRAFTDPASPSFTSNLSVPFPFPSELPANITVWGSSGGFLSPPRVYRAYGQATLRGSTVGSPLGALVDVIAGNIVTTNAPGDIDILPGVTLTAMDMSNPSGIQGVTPVSQSFLYGANGFCNSNVYKRDGNRGATNAKVGEEPEVATTSKNKLKLYPNPIKVGSQFVVLAPEADGSILSCTATDLTGKRIGLRMQTRGPSADVRLLTATPGVYLINITTSKTSHTSRVTVE